MMGVNEVGPPENASVLCMWLGDWAVLAPVTFLLMGLAALSIGFCLCKLAIIPSVTLQLTTFA